MMSDTLISFFTVAGPIIGFVLFAALLVYLRIHKGDFGEKWVSHILKSLPEGSYYVINDLMLRTNYGTSQIDHVVVSTHGVFVIETKFYSGWITGGENSEYWTKNVFGNKYQFRNPIIQNAGHVNAIRSAVPSLRGIPVVSIVAFSRQARLMVNTSSIVIYWNQLDQTIANYSQVWMTPVQTRDVALKLESLNVSSKETKKTHKQYARSQAYSSSQRIRNGICPRCGGSLVERHGRYGRFYGCSNYPKCKFTVNNRLP